MTPDFLRKSYSCEEAEKRRLVAAAFRSMLMDDAQPESVHCGKLLSFPGSVNRYERMIGLLDGTANPGRGERSKMFLNYRDELAREMKAARNARRAAMAAEGKWDFPELLRTDLEFMRILSGLRWMAVRYRFGFALDLRALSALVDEGVAFTASA